MEHIGKRVEIQFRGDPGMPWFAGNICKLNSNGSHMVRFDDGQKLNINLQEHIDEDIVRWPAEGEAAKSLVETPVSEVYEPLASSKSKRAATPAPKPAEVSPVPAVTAAKGGKKRMAADVEVQSQLSLIKRPYRAAAAQAVKAWQAESSVKVGEEEDEEEGRMGGKGGSAPKEEDEDAEMAISASEEDEDVKDEDEKKPKRKGATKSKGSPLSRRAKPIGSVAPLGVQSVAARGLPEGALARGRGGFEVRALERVAKLDASGGGRPSDPLPCRLLVVSAGIGVDETGQPLCPAHLVDQTFANGEELHGHTNGDICTYEMATTADEAWMGWDAMRRRLLAAGILTKPASAASPSSSALVVAEGFEAVVTVITCTDDDNDDGAPVATTRLLTQAVLEMATDRPDARWALLEGRSRDGAAVILSAPAWLVDPVSSSPSPASSSQALVASSEMPRAGAGADDGDGERRQHAPLSTALLPRLSNEARHVRLPASLVQKAIRRRAGVLCSAAPLLEACRALLLPPSGGTCDGARPARGASAAFLRAVCSSMLAEAMPAATSAGALGIDSLLALWVVALADPEWIMPPRLARQAVAAALRAQGRDTNQWVGFMRQSRKGEAVSSLRHIELEDARSLEDADTPTDSVCHPEGVGKEDTRRLGRRPEGVSEEGERLGRRVRNTLRVLHAALGLNFTFGHWGKYTGDRENGAMYVTLQQPGYDAVWLQHERLIAPVVTEEARLLDAWASPTTALSAVTAGLDARLLALDDETRRAAFDAHLLPSSLLLLQAALSSPPMRASKHGLTMLSRQWRKLSSEINPRDEQRMLLERVQANTGTGSTAGAIASTATEKQTDQSAVVGKAANDCVGDKGKGKRRSEEGSQVDTLAELSKLSSARELFEGMSDKEREIIEIVEEVQQWLLRTSAAALQGAGAQPLPPARRRDSSASANAMAPGRIATGDAPNGAQDGMVDGAPRGRRSSAGRPLSAHEGRTAFVLAFGRAMPLKVKVDEHTTESVTVLFCGTPDAPLLVQRTDHAAIEEAAGVSGHGGGGGGGGKGASGGTAGASGAAAAAPRLGYVLGNRSLDGLDDEGRAQAIADQKLYRAAVKAAAAVWEGGKTVSLPIPPRGLQWSLGAAAGDEDAAERSCYLTATLEDEEQGKCPRWRFAIAGTAVAPLDARAVLSSCYLPTTIKALTPAAAEARAPNDAHDPNIAMRLALLLRRAFYAHSKPADVADDDFEADGGKAAMVQLGLSSRLELFEELHAIATNARRGGADEGAVWGGWAELAASGVLRSGVWRDVLLKITTRDLDHVVIGPVAADGSGTGNDLSEGTILRLMYAMEALYPAVMFKDGALRWRVVPRGASYHHMLTCLERLGRAEVLTTAPAEVLTTAPMAALTAEGALAACALPSGYARVPVAMAETEAKALSLPSLKAALTARGLPTKGKKADLVLRLSASPLACTVSTASAAYTTSAACAPAAVKEEQEQEAAAAVRRPRRSSAAAASQAAAAIAVSEAAAGGGRDDGDFAAPHGANRGAKHSSAADVDLSAEYLPLPTITSTLWEHQQRSVDSVLAGVREGKLGFADASAVGAGKTLTALATVVGVAKHLHDSGIARRGSLVMLPQEALLREWLLELAKHSGGFHVVEQRADGTLFSLTYGNTGAPIDGNTIVISTLDRVAKSPFVRQAAWDFVVIDECLAVQNAAAKRCPSAWRQIEVSRCGCLLLSATFFRSKFHNLFYMVRMLRSPLPRTVEYLPALVHEHIVCEVPITDRSWLMEPGHVTLPNGKLFYSSEGSVPLADYSTYRRRISQWERDGLNRGDPSGLKLHADLKHLLRGELWEGAKGARTSPLAEAIAMQVLRLRDEGRRPVVFANTEDEKMRFRAVLRARGLTALSWAEINEKTRAAGFDVILATIGSEAQGINMQHDADAIVCRPTPGDVLEQIKGRVDRPGQTQSELKLVIVFAQATIEEAEAANIRLAGSFFRTYLAPKATKYKEALLQVDLAAMVAVHGGGEKRGAHRPKAGAVRDAWHSALEELTNANALQGHGLDVPAGSAGSSGEVMDVEDDDEEEAVERPVAVEDCDDLDEGEDGPASKRARGSAGKRGAAAKAATGKGKASADDNDAEEEAGVEPELKTINKTKRNRRSHEQYAAAKAAARKGQASLAVRRWLFKTEEVKAECLTPPEKDKLWEFSTASPPITLTRNSVEAGVRQLCASDPKLERIITRVGVNAIYMQVASFAAKRPSKVRLFDYLLHGITFSMISVDAGNAFLRKLAIKAGTLIEVMPAVQRRAALEAIATEMAESGDYEEGKAPTASELLDGKGGGLLLEANTSRLMFPPALVGVIVDACDKWGLPHLCAPDDDAYVKVGCGKNEGTQGFLNACRAHLKGTGGKVSVRYSLGALTKKGDRNGKGKFIIELVKRARRPDGLPDVATMSDRDAARRLMEIDGIGPWVAGECLVYHLGRADVMVSGDLTLRNMLNDLYNIDHRESETLVESAATFPDCARSRILLDRLARSNGWHGYRTLILFLSYFLQEDSLVLL
jgi:3-methyladenine DNA glycosylase/8-oxoguanine DNA glycosylase